MMKTARIVQQSPEAEIPTNLSLTNRLYRAAGAPNGIKKMRELILELAVRGKLVPQDPKDEPASELLKRIKAEKEKLVKAGKIRGGKPLPEITENEKIYLLPQGWEWTRLGCIGEWGAGATPLRSNSNYYGGGTPWFKSGELTSDFIDTSEETITELALKECSLRQNRPGDVLIAMYGATIGKSAILSVPATTNQAVCACTPFWGINNRYLLLLLKGLKPYFINQGAGGAQPNISREKIITTVFGLPPITMQHRIVAKVDELMALCDRLEAQEADAGSAHETLVEALLGTLTQSQSAEEFRENWRRIAKNFNILFTTEASLDVLKQTILQLAIMGKLVPQNPKDEPASDLLKRIRAEKEKLIKAGKIKKDKPLPEITDTEKPFGLPESWAWVRLGELGETTTGTTPPTTESDNFGNFIPFIKPADIDSDCNVTPNEYLSKQGLYVGRLIPANSILMVCIGGSIGKTGFCKINVSCNQQINAISPYAPILPRYILTVFRSNLMQGYVWHNATGSAQPIINKSKWSLAEIPLPPLTEQQCIVANVDELMAQCNSLKERITKFRSLHEQLAVAVVEKAVAASSF